MTKEEIAAWRELARRATRGPFHVTHIDEIEPDRFDVENADGERVCDEIRQCDFDWLVACSPNRILALLDRLERLEVVAIAARIANTEGVGYLEFHGALERLDAALEALDADEIAWRVTADIMKFGDLTSLDGVSAPIHKLVSDYGAQCRREAIEECAKLAFQHGEWVRGFYSNETITERDARFLAARHIDKECRALLEVKMDEGEKK